MVSVLQRFGIPALVLALRSPTPFVGSFVLSSTSSSTCSRFGAVSPRPMSTDSTIDESPSTKVLRVLALHGSEGTAEEFPSRLEALKTSLKNDKNIELEITAVEGPFPKGDGFSWWEMPPGVRSFTATTYGGFEESSHKVLESWKLKDDSEPYDLVLGHSQGAIMIASLLSLGLAPYHPSVGYVFNGVSYPNPYREQIGELKVVASDKSPSFRVLFVMGTNDKITPNETGKELMDAFRKAGLDAQLVTHPGGHGVPNKVDETIDEIVEWISHSFS